MTLSAHRAVWIDAAVTTLTAVSMLAARGMLFPYFGLNSPRLLDLTAAAFIVYAIVIGRVASRPAISRTALMTVATANVTFVIASVTVLVAFWSQLHPVGRSLIVVTAVAVEMFAMLQFAAARRRVEIA